MSPRTDSEATRSFQARLRIPLFIYVIAVISTALFLLSGSMCVRNSCCCFATPCMARRAARRITARCLASLPFPHPTSGVKRERKGGANAKEAKTRSPSHLCSQARQRTAVTKAVSRDSISSVFLYCDLTSGFLLSLFRRSPPRS